VTQITTKKIVSSQTNGKEGVTCVSTRTRFLLPSCQVH